MKRVKGIATILFYLTRCIALLFLLGGLYGSTVLFFTRGGNTGAWPIAVENDHFTLFYPFTRSPFFLGDYDPGFVLTSFSAILLYGIFLWLLASVFNAFRQDRLFTGKNVVRLLRFYVFNLIVPPLVLLVLFATGERIRDVLIICLLHVMLGIFVFFTTTIFRQGLLLQEEQDLIL